MGKMKQIISLLFFMSCAVGVYARQISIQVIQHDSGIEEVTEQSFIVEDNILNGFFDEGYIVTNSQAEISESEAQDETLFKKGLGEAFEGYSDYFVQIKLFYEREGSTDASKANLQKVDYLVASTKTGVTVKNNSIKNTFNKNRTDDLYAMSACLLKEIKNAIKA